MTEHSSAARIFLLGAAALAALTAYGRGTLHTPGAKSTDLAPDAGADAYRQIVQGQCVVDWLQHHSPAPCERLFLSDAEADSPGYAVLADPDGGAQYLLIPTQTMTGTDASELLDPNLPNYFAEAWRARDLLSKFVGHPVPSADVALVVVKAAARVQHQFHIHIACLRQDVANALKQVASQVTGSWAPINVAGFPFEARSLSAQALEVSNPFELVAGLNADARHQLANYTVVLAGAPAPGGPGFIMLTGNGPSGDLLLDSTCAVAGGGG